MSKATPLIRPIATQGGTFYTFPSAAEDLTFAFNNETDRRFRFSKFVLLNIPDIRTDPIKNTIKLNAIPGAFRSVNLSRTNDLNNHLAESFQNYALNLETLLASRDDYDFTNAATVSERTFWKWLKELGAMRYRVSQTVAPNDSANPSRYEEEQEGSNYSKVVVYQGEIDFLNNLFTNTNSYTEVYVHIPDFTGSTPTTYFKVLDDSNYTSGLTVKRPPTKNSQDDEYLSGRAFDDEHPAGLDTHAFYDNDSGLGTLQSRITSAIEQYKKIPGRTGDQLDIDTDYVIDSWWYKATTEVNAYYTEPDTLFDAGNDDLAIFSARGNPSGVNRNESATRFRRSRLDGVCIDWDLDTYTSNYPGALSFQDINSSPNSKDFAFNAVLFYYDLFKFVEGSTGLTAPETIQDDATGELEFLFPDIKTLSTNLFGILFLDNVENDIVDSSGFIPRFSKCRPNPITKANGNAYGIKLNLKLNTSPYNSGIEVETIVSDSNLLSMDIYADAINIQRKLTEDIGMFLGRTLDVDTRTRTLETLLTGQGIDNPLLFNERLKALEQVLSEGTDKLSTVRNISNLLDSIAENRRLLQSILQGKIENPLAFDLDFFFSYGSIQLDKSRQGKLGIGSSGRSYNLGEQPQVSVLKDFVNSISTYDYVVPLQSEANYIRLRETTRFIPRKDLRIFIDDVNVSWKRGQSFRLKFSNDYKMENEFGSFDLYLYTDHTNRIRSSEPYSVLIGKVSGSEFTSRGGMPTLEVICVDDVKMEFILDIIN